MNAGEMSHACRGVGVMVDWRRVSGLRDVVQRQAVIELTEGRAILHLSKIMSEYNGKISEGKDVRTAY